MIYSGTDPASYITEYALVYEDNNIPFSVITHFCAMLRAGCEATPMLRLHIRLTGGLDP